MACKRAAQGASTTKQYRVRRCSEKSRSRCWPAPQLSSRFTPPLRLKYKAPPSLAWSMPIRCPSGRRRCERRHGAAKRQDRASMLRPLHLGGSRDHSARCAARRATAARVAAARLVELHGCHRARRGARGTVAGASNAGMNVAPSRASVSPVVHALSLEMQHVSRACSRRRRRRRFRWRRVRARHVGNQGSAGRRTL